MDDAQRVEPLELSPYYLFCRSSLCEKVKLFTGTAAVSLLILVIIVGVILKYAVLQLHPAINFVLLFFGLMLLAYVESLHYAVVAVEKWDMSLYAERFPRAAKCHTFVDTPEKVKKFLVGRQFFVIFVVFLIAEITTFDRKFVHFPLVSHLRFSFFSFLFPLRRYS
jgi:uncharacterized membrane protein (Fun14 family)